MNGLLFWGWERYHDPRLERCFSCLRKAPRSDVRNARITNLQYQSYTRGTTARQANEKDILFLGRKAGARERRIAYMVGRPASDANQGAERMLGNTISQEKTYSPH